MKSVSLLALSLVALVGCSDPVNTELRGNVAVSWSTRSAAAVPQFAVAAGPVTTALSDTITNGPDTLIITSAQLVIREIELEPVEVGDCGDSNPVGCAEVELGPFLVDLPLTPGAMETFAVEIPEGTYDEIEFDIHKVSDDDPADAAFRQAHPEFVDKSIRVQGTFNGDPFLYETDLNVEQELDLVPFLVVRDQSNTNLTVRADITSWFRQLSGALIDPDTANKGGMNESVVNENIKTSFEAFEDPDRDGD